MPPTDLLTAAKDVMKKAHAPYSKFTVGAALETTSGDIFVGCNVENASYGGTVCAERIAIFSAVAAGQKQFKKIVLISQNSKPITPCGMCRQVMAEFFDSKTEIHCYGQAGKTPDVYKLSDLLPKAFEFTR